MKANINKKLKKELDKKVGKIFESIEFKLDCQDSLTDIIHEITGSHTQYHMRQFTRSNSEVLDKNAWNDCWAYMFHKIAEEVTRRVKKAKIYKRW